MQHSPNQEFKYFKEIPIHTLNERKFPVYIIDYGWNYLFVNEAAKNNLTGIQIEGRNIRAIWEELPHLNFKPIYFQLKDQVEAREPLKVRVTSPITNKVIEITGKPLADCYYFSIIELPDKESLLSELRTIVKKGQ